MVDLTAAVEAASRARWDQARRTATHLPAWDALSPMRQYRIREDLLPAIAAAATVIEAQVLADAAKAVEDLSWRREFVELTHGLDMDLTAEGPACGHWARRADGSVVLAPVVACATCHHP